MKKNKFRLKVLLLTIGGLVVWLLIIAFSAWILMLVSNIILNQLSIKNIDYKFSLIIILVIGFIVEYIDRKNGNDNE